MQDSIFWLTVCGSALIGLVILARTVLSGWRGWLELERMKLDGLRQEPQSAALAPSSATRIELADLKERVRKLEAIAAGVDL